MRNKYLSIRLNAILHILGIFLVIIGVVFFTMRFLAFQGIEKLEREQAVLQLQRVKDGLSFTEEMMMQTVNDWSKWDETYDYVEGLNPLFPDDNFYIEALDSIKMNMAMIYSLNQTRLYEVAYDFNLWESIDINQDIYNQIEQAGFISHIESDSPFSGLLTYQDQVMIVVSSPIMRSDYGGEPNGILVFIRVVDDELIASLESVTGITFSIGRNDTLNDNQRIMLTQLGSYQMNVKSVIEDINSNHDLMIEMVITMEASRIMRDTIHIIILILSIILSMFLLILVIMLDQIMFKRISKMRDNINILEKFNNIKLRLDVDHRQDEISFIGREMNKLLDKLESSYNEVNKIAYADHLTGTYSRLAFHHYLDEQMVVQNNKFSILFLDLDGFKAINDECGHEVGDMLLIEASKRIKDIVGSAGVISRTGGDEFLILLYTYDRDDISNIAKSLISSIAYPYIIEGLELKITASIGVACYPENGTTRKTLIKYADMAMYNAKSLGKNQFQFKHK